MLYIILAILVIIFVIIIIFINYHHKFQYFMIRMDEAENNIDLLLQKKIEYIGRSVPIIREKTKENDFLENFDEIKEADNNHFELNTYLNNSYVEIIKIVDDNEKLSHERKLEKILENLEDNEEDLSAAIKFYNDNAKEFNQLISTFPSNLVRLFLHLKKKELYANEKKEIYEILKEK